MLKQILEVKDVSGTIPDTLEVRCLCDDDKERTVTQHRSAFYGPTAGVDRKPIQGLTRTLDPESLKKDKQKFKETMEDITSEIIPFSAQPDGDSKRRLLMWQLCEEKIMALWVAENPPEPKNVTGEFT